MRNFIIAVRFYDVTEYGYYDRKNGLKRFGSFQMGAHELADFVKSSGELRDSCTFPVAETGAKQNLGVYCYDFAESSDEYLLVIWNQTPTVNGSVLTVSLEAGVGTQSARQQPVRPGYIPGWPSYWWLMPKQGQIASLRFPSQTLLGHAELDRYLRGFLRWSSPQVRYEEKPDEVRVIGYARSLDGELYRNVNPRFSTVVTRKAADIDGLISQAGKITHVIRKDDMVRNRKTFVSEVMRQIGFSKDARVPSESEVWIEMRHTPDPADLKALIGDWAEKKMGQNLGFKLKGSGSTIHWLTNAFASGHIELSGPPPSRAGVYLARPLLDIIHANRKDMLGIKET